MKIIKKLLPIFLMISLLIIIHPSVSHAETANENQVSVALTADNQFSLYLSTNDTEKGELILNGADPTKVYQSNAQLTIGKKYYLHIEGIGDYATNGFIGKFDIKGNGFRFKNGSTTITTNQNDIKVSKIGFGLNYESPTICAFNYKSISNAWVCIT
jgi:hypothetical protein